MGTKMTKMTFESEIDVALPLVYEAFTNAYMLQQWLCSYAHATPQPDGRLFLEWPQGFYAAGEYTELTPNETAAFTWQGRQEPVVSQVRVTMSADNGRSHLTLIHSDVPAGDEWADMRQELRQGWETGLANLKSVLETGIDRRIYERPFLGIMVAGVVSAEQADDLGLPVAGGIRISGTAPDTGAAAMGLQNEDIIVNLGGSDVTDFPSLQAALRPFKAGERVKVTYFRNGEKQSGVMALSQRPLPRVPQTPAALAEELQEVYAQLDGELDDLLAGVTDDEATQRPGAGEWHLLDVLAHLIGTERHLQISIAAQITGSNLNTYPANPPAWNQSITAVYPTLAAITDAWKKAEAETVALVAALPPDFVAHKIHYTNTANSVLNGYPAHTRSHFGQMRAAIDAARQAT